MNESKSLAGRYKMRVGHVVAPSRSSGSIEPVSQTAGAVIELCHEDAVRFLADKSAEPFDSRGCSACKKLGHRPCSIECYAALGGSTDPKKYHADMVLLETKLAQRNKAARDRVTALDKEGKEDAGEIDLTKDYVPPPPAPETPVEGSGSSQEPSGATGDAPPVKSGRKPAPAV